jgi:hypothetical protein
MTVESSFTDLIVELYFGHKAVVRLLAEKGTNVNSEDNDGWTPLSWATENGHKTLVKLLLEKGADIDSESKTSRTSLLCAAEKGHEAVVMLVLKKGANVGSNFKYDQTPPSWAAVRATEGTLGGSEAAAREWGEHGLQRQHVWLDAAAVGRRKRARGGVGAAEIQDSINPTPLPTHNWFISILCSVSVYFRLQKIA